LTDEERAAVLLALASASDDQLCGALFSGSTAHLPAGCQLSLAHHCRRIVEQNQALLDAQDGPDPRTAIAAASNVKAYGLRVREFTAAALGAL
jgi:hypothetical protein